MYSEYLTLARYILTPTFSHSVNHHCTLTVSFDAQVLNFHAVQFIYFFLLLFWCHIQNVIARSYVTNGTHFDPFTKLSSKNL